VPGIGHDDMGGELLVQDFAAHQADRIIMALEMIEPSLYLRMDQDRPQRFADAFDSYVAKKDAERLQ